MHRFDGGGLDGFLLQYVTDQDALDRDEMLIVDGSGHKPT
jgi:hypothetical protein